MQGTKQSTSVALLQDAFNALQITTKVPGLVNLQDKLLMSAFANFNLTNIGALANATLCPGGFFHIAQPVFLFANNKFSSNLVITGTWHRGGSRSGVSPTPALLLQLPT